MAGDRDWPATALIWVGGLVLALYLGGVLWTCAR